MTIPCIACKAPISSEHFFGNCHAYWPELKVLKFTCPGCGKTSDIQIGNGAVSFGYVYAAGSAHFASMETTALPGLTAVQTQEGALLILADERRWTIRKEAAA